ncbi:MAG: GNAT family N-acetyltransferase [Planctomycetaceae bacterium]|nr:GNAT family N-acetyltransferase [Planctomycetaceae bacterium]
MSQIFRKLVSCLSLIYQRQFFLLAELVCAALIPSRIFATKKYLFYRLDRQQQTSPNIKSIRKNIVKNISENIEIFIGTESSVSEMVDTLYNGKPKTLEFYEEFYRNGIEAWIARGEDKIVGVIWLYTGSYLLNWEGYDAWLLQVAVEPTAKFVANVFVQPECRGQGIFPVIAEQCFTVYSENEFYSCVEESNVPSIKSHEKIGFRRYAAVYFVRFFQQTYCLSVPKKGKWKYFRLQRGNAIVLDLLSKQK